MLEKYFDNENFKRWYNHNLFISSLTGDPYIFDIVLENNNHYKVIFLSGHMLGYKSFISHFSRYDRYNYFREYNKKYIPPDELMEIFIRIEVVSKKIDSHPYYTKAKPRIHYTAGPRWKYIFDKLAEYEDDKLYYITDILAGEMEPGYGHNL